MRITEVRAIPLAVPLAPTTPASPWADGLSRQILVRVATDAGLTGWGEAFAYGPTAAVCAVVEEALAPLLVGQDPTRRDTLVQSLQRALMIWGRRGLGMFALSGVELALWDLEGKALGVPVHRLLGGLAQPRLRAYASLLRYPNSSDVGRACAAALARGFTAIKLHQTDVESVAVARDVIGDGVDLMLDTNCPWSVEEAIRVARELAPYRLRWLEEPVWPPEDYAGLARVRAVAEMPIASGENDATAFGARDLIAAGAADIVQPSVTKVGGLGEMQRIAALAATAGVTFQPHSFYFGPGLAATVHLIAATPGVPYIEMPPGDLAAPLLREPIRCEAGWVSPSDRPGLGADPDPAVLERHAYQPGAYRPFRLA